MKKNHEIRKFSIRTDLAIEVTEQLEKSKLADQHEDIYKNVTIKSKEGDGFLLTHVIIKNEEGSEEIGKPIGNYITIESQKLKDNASEYHEKIIDTLSKELQSLCNLGQKDSVLITGLGNWNITPDALGPKVVSKLLVTRHLHDVVPEEISGSLRSVAAISPGVMGITGIETGEIIKGLVENLKPTLLIAIDSLAARRSSRINATIQMSDTGIAPGAGVGNPRMLLNKDTLGIPVIAIGVPTVVDAATLVNDTMDSILEDMISHTDGNTAFYEMLQDLQEEEKYHMITTLLDPYTENMFVTPKEVDAVIERLSSIIANGINIALHRGITLEDIGKYMS